MVIINAFNKPMLGPLEVFQTFVRAGELTVALSACNSCSLHGHSRADAIRLFCVSCFAGVQNLIYRNCFSPANF
jgi:hypothetical protein